VTVQKWVNDARLVLGGASAMIDSVERQETPTACTNWIGLS